MQASREGRFVQVAISKGHMARGPYGPFRLLTIAGYESSIETGNLYFAAVKQNPLDPERTLLGLFPVALTGGGVARSRGIGSNHTGIIGLSVSCDGVQWVPLVVLSTCRTSENRTFDQPADGFVVRGSTVFAIIHRHVEG